MESNSKFLLEEINLTLEDIRKFVESKGAILRSNVYLGYHKKLHLTCNNGHDFSKTVANLKRAKSENLCPFCVGNFVYDMEIYINEILQNLNCKLVGELPKCKKDFVRFICINNHEISRKVSALQELKNCPECFKIIRKLEASKVLEKVVEEKGGTLLSEYTTTRQKVKIKCFNGHIFEKQPDKITSGNKSWCPKCSSSVSKGEAICMKVFQEIFKKEFVKTRSIPWLKAPNGSFLELDGYCAELGIAFEYQGEQHYKEVIFGGKSKIHWKSPKYDKLKVELCLKNNVKLFVIPYFELSNIKELINKNI